MLEREIDRVRDAGHEERHDVLEARAASVAASLGYEREPSGGAARRVPAAVLSAWSAAILGVAAALVAFVTWSPAFEWLSVRWFDDHGYYGHGPLVPLIALALAWRARHRLAPRPDAAGLRWGGRLLAAAVLLQVAAAALRIHFASGVALYATIVATALLLGGVAFTRALAFPLAFLALALPLPMGFIARVSLELKMIAAGVATGSLNLVGITAVREGSAIHLWSGDVMVEDACSGLRSLLALLSMGVLVAGIDRGIPVLRRLVVVAFAFPIAIAANAVRVQFLCLAVHFAGPSILDTWVHEGSGFFVYAISLALLLAVRRLVSPTPEDSPAPLVTIAVAPPARRVGALALALVPCALATVALDRKPSVSAPPIAQGLPLTVGSWAATELPIEDYVRKILDTNDLISRRYTKGGSRPVYLYVAASRGDRKVAHPPEVCAPGNGYTVEEHQELDLAHGVRAVRFMLVRGADKQMIAYFYAAGTWLGPSYVWSQLRAAVERFRSPDVPSALVRLSAPVRNGEDPEETWTAFRDFAGDLVPALQARLTEEGKQ